MTKREYKKQQQIIDDKIRVRMECIHNDKSYHAGVYYRKTFPDDLPSVTEIHKTGKG